MIITKYEHACLDIKEGTSRLVIDPGAFSSSFDDTRDIAAVVITHVHGDHLDTEKVKDIATSNPDVQIFATQEVAAELDGITVTVPNIGQVYTAGDFSLEFFGGEHAVILPSNPVNQNFGVLVSETLYYPGDSLTPCPKPHSVLALPTVAPWLKLSEAAEFLAADSATTVFPTHNALSSEIGEMVNNNTLRGEAETDGKVYKELAVGDSLEA